MGKTYITAGSDYIITEEALGTYTPNGSYADISDMAGKSVLELLRNYAWTLRQRNDLLAQREDRAIELGAAHHARVQAQRKLIDAKAAFKKALAALNEAEIEAAEVATVVYPELDLTPLPPHNFTAINGIELFASNNGKISGPNPGTEGWPDAVAEFLYSDRNDWLFTWRFPQNDHLVVIRNETLRDKDGSRWVHVYDDRIIAGHSWYCSDQSTVDPQNNNPLHLAAHAYFQAVPMND